jgi:YidC/Oxa1 family membrane protein insertase
VLATLVLAANALFDPLVNALSVLLTSIHHIIPNYGWALIALAAVVRLVLWPLSNMQFRSMAEMQKVQPLVKQIQAKYKGDPQAQNAAMMALYKEHKVNPLAGCLPMLIPMPILIGLFWAIQNQIQEPHSPFLSEHWLWIGSPLSAQFPQVFAANLGVPDIFLLALYVVSMYFTVRYGSPPSSDPQQQQTQKMMAFISPAMIAFFGFKYRWASALYIYWLATNVFTVAQQYFMFRKYGLIGPKRAETLAAAADEPLPAIGKAAKAKSGTNDGAAAAANGKRSYRAKKRARR